MAHGTQSCAWLEECDRHIQLLRASRRIQTTYSRGEYVALLGVPELPRWADVGQYADYKRHLVKFIAVLRGRNTTGKFTPLVRAARNALSALNEIAPDATLLAMHECVTSLYVVTWVYAFAASRDATMTRVATVMRDFYRAVYTVPDQSVARIFQRTADTFMQKLFQRLTDIDVDLTPSILQLWTEELETLSSPMYASRLREELDRIRRAYAAATPDDDGVVRGPRFSLLREIENVKLRLEAPVAPAAPLPPIHDVV